MKTEYEKAIDAQKPVAWVERAVGQTDQKCADDRDHYWDCLDDSDETVCPCCGGDGMDPMTDYALACPVCGWIDGFPASPRCR